MVRAESAREPLPRHRLGPSDSSPVRPRDVRNLARFVRVSEDLRRKTMRTLRTAFLSSLVLELHRESVGRNRRGLRRIPLGTRRS